MLVVSVCVVKEDFVITVNVATPGTRVVIHDNINWSDKFWTLFKVTFHNLTGLNFEKLQRKIDLCVELLDFSTILDPGYGALRTALLKELHGCLSVLFNIKSQVILFCHYFWSISLNCCHFAFYELL